MAFLGVPGSGVRPTKRCLEEDLRAAIPHLGIRLEDIDQSCVVAAQTLPELYKAGGCERITSLTDRVWFKVKTSNERGAATRLDTGLVENEGEAHDHPGLGQWWLGAAGTRRGDSTQTDFYDALQAGCERRKRQANSAGANIKTSTLSDHLLPESWDARRLTAETAEHVRSTMRHHVREMAALSVTSGKVISFTVNEYVVKVLVRGDGGETYLAVATRGVGDLRFFAMLLDCFRPLIDPKDWLPEPEQDHMGIVPDEDEMVWSALIAPEQAAELLDPG